MTGAEPLTGAWDQAWPGCPPIAYLLKDTFPDRWVRFHSLPASKRYPSTADEYATVLHRHNTVIDELCGEDPITLVTCRWGDQPQPHPDDEAKAWHPGGVYWRSVPPGGTRAAWTHLIVSLRRGRPGRWTR